MFDLENDFDFEVPLESDGVIVAWVLSLLRDAEGLFSIDNVEEFVLVGGGVTVLVGVDDPVSLSSMDRVAERENVIEALLELDILSVKVVVLLLVSRRESVDD